MSPGLAALAIDSTGLFGTWTDSRALVPELVRSGTVQLSAIWKELFTPLRAGMADDLMVVGQFGQSLDGRVAAAAGHSHCINGPAGLAHLHRLRALVDAVVIGVGTALMDDPQLTVRRVSGRQPARGVIDPGGRLPRGARLLADDGVRRIVVIMSGVPPSPPQGRASVPRRCPAPPAGRRSAARCPPSRPLSCRQRPLARFRSPQPTHTRHRPSPAGLAGSDPERT